MLKKIKIILLVLFFFTGCAENDKNFKQFNIEDLNITKLKESNFNKDLSEFYIINFWASWCKPCRDQSPELVDLYNTYQSKGVTIMSVSLDRSNERWLQAIKDDHLNWTHVSNLKHWKDPIAAEYNVRSIPELFLIDNRGAVLARSHDLASIKSILQNATADL